MCISTKFGKIIPIMEDALAKGAHVIMPTPQVNPDGTYPARALPNPTRRPLETRREAAGPLHTPATDAASVVHGLRNPLAGIRATVQIARERANDPELTALLSDALREADRLDARIRALLELSRPLAAQLGPVDLAALFEAVVEALGPRCSACGVKIEAHIDLLLPRLRRLHA